MTITEFAKSRNIEPQAVSRYIGRHEEFEGHISVNPKNGKEKILDDIAIELLDKKYPLPKPIEVIEGVEPKEYQKVVNSMLELQELNNKMQEQLLDAQELIAGATAQKLMLEDRDRQIQELKAEIEKSKEELSKGSEEIMKTKIELEQIKKEVSSYKKSLFGFYKKEK